MKTQLNKLFKVGIALCLSMLFSSFAFAQSDEQCSDALSQLCNGVDANICLDGKAKWDKLAPGCIPHAQTMFEMANEANAQIALEGASLGGSVRSGAGTNFAKVGSLTEGALIELEKNTGVMMNGYPWFKITKYGNSGETLMSGYQWGGIVCSFQARDGVYEQCPGGWSAFEGGSDAKNAMKQDAIAPRHGNGDEGNLIGEDPIAPTHGNSDEDNEMIALEAVEACLTREKNNGNDGKGCIGEVADTCMEMGKDYSTLGMRQCFSLEHSAWDTLLNQDYKILMESLDSSDKKTKLRNAQRHWVKFITAFCPLGYEINQGTKFLVSDDICRMEMTARQDFEMRRLLNPMN